RPGRMSRLSRNMITNEKTALKCQALMDSCRVLYSLYPSILKSTVELRDKLLVKRNEIWGKSIP
ncbi:hypothetical protein, partial [Methylacidiphilum caldifontis]|uniref:hypothetical protein n=1 Tax=Methylacidiphilum caldifontis TaxID=2795386 RepID=UPI001ABCF73B